jgi:DNA-nicking Smr family endonuclease
LSNKKITKEDQELFRESIGIVEKIASDLVILTPEKPKPLNTRGSTINQTDTNYGFSSLAPVMGEKLFYARPSTPRRTINALRKGKIEIEATLDLHGLTSKQAEQLLSKFMQQSLRDGLFSLLIVHGKGFGSPQKHPVLKNLVNNWLRNQNYVIAFCSAGHHDGGTGAVRALIDH